jgi:hypothetical protein
VSVLFDLRFVQIEIRGEFVDPLVDLFYLFVQSFLSIFEIEGILRLILVSLVVGLLILVYMISLFLDLLESELYVSQLVLILSY